MNTKDLETNTQTIERLTRERDEAQARCAEMREYLLFAQRSGFETVDRAIEHALGSDCGKGRVPVGKLVEALEAFLQMYADAASGCPNCMPIMKRVTEAIADIITTTKEL